MIKRSTEDNLSTNDIKRIHKRNESNLSSKSLSTNKYLFIYKDESDTNDEDELLNQLQNIHEHITPVTFWDGIKRELQPNYIVLIDNENIIVNKMMISNLYPSIPIISFTQNVTLYDDSIIHFANIPSLISLLNKQLI